MMKYIIAITALTLLFSADATAASGQAAEATQMITDIMREVLGVIVEFIGDILDELVRAIKEIF